MSNVRIVCNVCGGEWREGEHELRRCVERLQGRAEARDRVDLERGVLTGEITFRLPGVKLCGVPLALCTDCFVVWELREGEDARKLPQDWPCSVCLRYSVRRFGVAEGWTNFSLGMMLPPIGEKLVLQMRRARPIRVHAEIGARR